METKIGYLLNRMFFRLNCSIYGNLNHSMFSEVIVITVDIYFNRAMHISYDSNGV